MNRDAMNGWAFVFAVIAYVLAIVALLLAPIDVYVMLGGIAAVNVAVSWLIRRR